MSGPLFRWCRRLAAAALCGCGLLLGAGALAYALTPIPAGFEANLPASDTRILDRHGELIADLPRGGLRHDVVPLSGFAAVLRQATVAAEDASFYSNPGVDPLAIARAALLDVRDWRVAYGGSTITQQLVRNVLLPARERGSRSPWRKIHEALLALKLTRHLDKNDILALYLNSVSYGNLTYGAEAASRLYFGRPAAELDLAQAALLAGLPRAPSLFDPLRHPAAARQRQLVVLRLMQRHGMITGGQERLAEAEPLRIGSAAPYLGSLAPHWVAYVMGLVADRLGAERVAAGGLTIRTTLDLRIQQAAQDAVRRQIAKIASEHQAHDAAVVAIAPNSGQILAMVGSADASDPSIDGAYNVALAPRQPGSAIKPFTYLAALDRWSPGARSGRYAFTAATLLDDVPSSFRAPDGSTYQPLDYDAHFLGRVPLRVALGASLNVPAVETLQRIGIARMLQVAHAAGITTMYRTDRYGPALTLGGGEVTLLDLTSAYSTIAAGGIHRTPSAILGVADARGHALADWSPPPAAQAFGPRGPQLAALMTDILSDDSARLPSFGAGSLLVLPDRPAAAKTGTTTDWHDNWTVGYTPDLAVGVWTGNADNAPMVRITGITGAAPIWHDVMEAALRGVAPRPFLLPPGMVRETICRDTGLLLSTSCRQPAVELFIAGTQPTTSGSGQPAAGSVNPTITNPADGTRYLISPDIPAWAQRIGVTVGGEAPAVGPGSAGGEPGRHELFVDGRPVGTCTGQPCSVYWTLQPGRHHLWSGRAPGIWISVAASGSA